MYSRYVLVPVKSGTSSCFSNCRNPSSVIGFLRNPAGMYSLELEENLRTYRQQLTDLNTARENEGRIDYDYQEHGVLHKAESRYLKEPWTITSVQNKSY
jgi:hypothetical protein